MENSWCYECEDCSKTITVSQFYISRPEGPDYTCMDFYIKHVKYSFIMLNERISSPPRAVTSFNFWLYVHRYHSNLPPSTRYAPTSAVHYGKVYAHHAPAHGITWHNSAHFIGIFVYKQMYHVTVTTTKQLFLLWVIYFAVDSNKLHHYVLFVILECECKDYLLWKRIERDRTFVLFFTFSTKIRPLCHCIL